MRTVSFADAGTRKDIVAMASPYIDFRPAPDRLPPLFSVFIVQRYLFVCVLQINFVLMQKLQPVVTPQQVRAIDLAGPLGCHQVPCE
jgi:hypothetical protein